MAYELREVASAADRKAYHAIRKSVLFDARGRASYDENHPDDKNPANLPLILLCDGRPVCAFRFDCTATGAGIIRLMAVARDEQRLGHGRAAITQLMGRARAMGLHTIEVNSAPYAAEFYRRQGFQMIDEKRASPLLRMNLGETWSPGTQILARSVYNGHVRFAVPMTVVSDASDRLVAYQCEGTATLSSTYDAAAGRFGAPFTRRWHTSNVLKFYEPGAWAAVWCVWDARTWAHGYWYVDFQQPARRDNGGLISKDLALDIVVYPDFSWKWKDEDHFALRQADGLISAEEASAVRAEAERMVARIESRAAPFNEPWPVWRPDPAWPIPTLPTLAECIGPNRASE